MEFFFFHKKSLDSQTFVQRPSLGSLICSRCSDVALCFKYPYWDSTMVVVVGRWSLFGGKLRFGCIILLLILNHLAIVVWRYFFKYSQTCVQRSPMGPVVDKWSLFRGYLCHIYMLLYISSEWGLKMIVVSDRWSLFEGGRWLRFDCTGKPRYSRSFYLRIRLYTLETLALNARFLVKMRLFICEFSIRGPI